MKNVEVNLSNRIPALEARFDQVLHFMESCIKINNETSGDDFDIYIEDGLMEEIGFSVRSAGSLLGEIRSTYSLTEASHSSSELSIKSPASAEMMDGDNLRGISTCILPNYRVV